MIRRHADEGPLLLDELQRGRTASDPSSPVAKAQNAFAGQQSDEDSPDESEARGIDETRPHDAGRSLRGRIEGPGVSDHVHASAKGQG